VRVRESEREGRNEWRRLMHDIWYTVTDSVHTQHTQYPSAEMVYRSPSHSATQHTHTLPLSLFFLPNVMTLDSFIASGTSLVA
jgi:hypothetical protein